ncbi:hypothetical protein AF35_01653 [Enterobacter roggenkampii CHS 79]|nr:hypothetical protein AF35_01653 [Enterobacter roggenkampii CHS 79]OUF10883.1 hypothetical protein AZZ95_002599 [Enterobacter roggenkampii]
MASVNRRCFRDIIEKYIQITIWITIINKTDVSVFMTVSFFT